MIAAWMVYVVLVSVLVAAGARLLETAWRRAGLPLRFLWVGGLVAVLGLAVAAPLRLTLQSATTVRSVVDVTGTAGAEAAAAVAPTIAADVFAAVKAGALWPLRVVAQRTAGNASRALGIGWLLLTVALLFAGAATLARYRMARRSWPVRNVAGSLVRVAPAAGPAVVGLMRPEIVVPAWLLDLPAPHQRLVLLHEREHLAARDPFLLLGAAAIVTIVPWNPVGWWMFRRARLAVELDCDARVLRRGVQPRAYGSMLIEVASRGSTLTLAAPALVGGTSQLERRLLAMNRRFSRPVAGRAAMGALFGGTALFAACETRLPTAAELEQMDVAAVEAEAERWRVTATEAGTAYYLDGVELTAEEARDIAADRIARVEVLLATADEGRRIHISSKDDDADRRRAEVTAALAGADRAAKLREVQRDSPDGRTDGGMRAVPMSGFDGLIVVDGVRITTADMGRLDPNTIEGIEVIKGPAAAALYRDAEAANGVIRITTTRDN